MDWTKEGVSALLERINGRMLSLTNEFLEETCPIGIIDFDKWEWPQGVGLYGMWKYARLSGKQEYVQRLEEWYTARICEGLPERNVNTTAPMLTLSMLAYETRREDWMELCRDWARWVMEEMTRTEEGGIQHVVSGERNDGQLWDDTLFMTVLFLANMAELEDRDDWREEAAYQFLLHTKYLQDAPTGLWFHGWSFEGRHNFAKALWARGNCWITVGIPEYLETARVNAEVRRYLTGVLENQVRALAECQDASGLWHTLLDDPGSYLESSASAGFACGILKGVRTGLLPEQYRETALRAVQAVAAETGADGVVGKVSYGTGMGRTLDHYREIPCCPMAYGQSLPVMMLCEVLEELNG